MSSTSTALAADYYVTVDALEITRDGASIFLDEFNDGAAPPAAPNFAGGTPATYGVTGGFAESGGRAILDGSVGALAFGIGTDDPIVTSSATLNRFGWLENNGAFTRPITITPHISTAVDGINDAGTYVGSSYKGGVNFTAYVNEGGVVTEFNASGSSITRGEGINNAGTTVGFYDNMHSFVKDGAVVTSFDHPQGVRGTFAQDINEAGHIVGY